MLAPTLPANYNNSQFLAVDAGGAAEYIPIPTGPKPNLGVGPCNRYAEVAMLEQLEEIYDALAAQYALKYANLIGPYIPSNNAAQLAVGQFYSPAATPVSLYGWNIINPAAETIYVKFYDSIAVPVAGDIPVLVLSVPTLSTLNQANTGIAQLAFANRISVRAVQGIGNADNTPPETPLSVTLIYK